MARTDACAGCGTELAPDARYCVKCGRTRAAPLLELPRVDITPEPESGVERAVVEGRRGWRPSGSVMALVALLVVLVGAVLLLSGGDNGDEASAPTTSSPSETTRPRRPRSTTTQPPVLTETLAPPVLGAPTGGLSLYAVSGTAMVRVELDSGTVTVVRSAFRGSGSYTNAVVVSDGRVVVGRDSEVYVLPADILGEPQRLEGFDLESSFNTGRLLSVEGGFPEGTDIDVREFDPDGNILNEWRVPSPSWMLAAMGDRLLVQAAGQLYLLGTDGSVELYGTGETLFAGGTKLLWRRCDENLVCSVMLDDVVTGDSFPVASSGDERFYGYYAQSISPDGRFAVVTIDDEPRLVDLATGEERSGPSPNMQPAWSPDSAWLFTRGERDELLAISTRGLETVEIPMPEGFVLGTSELVLAVG
jgi:hypothetical protein